PSPTSITSRLLKNKNTRGTRYSLRHSERDNFEALRLPLAWCLRGSFSFVCRYSCSRRNTERLARPEHICNACRPSEPRHPSALRPQCSCLQRCSP
ncbi:unnamed protein product, partial [Amoebophrya sp. A120]